MQIGNKIFDTEHHTAVMAILNVTPDSFSDGGSYKNMDDIRRRVSQMIEEGAVIIDIGGESQDRDIFRFLTKKRSAELHRLWHVSRKILIFRFRWILTNRQWQKQLVRPDVI